PGPRPLPPFPTRRSSDLAARPTLPGAEYVAVGETAAGGEPRKAGQALGAGQQLAHVHVDRVEAGLGKGPGHFRVAVAALLAQDGHLRPGAVDPRCRDIFACIKRDTGRQAWIVNIKQAVVFLLSALRRAAQRLQAIAGLAPAPLQVNALIGKHAPAAVFE